MGWPISHWNTGCSVKYEHDTVTAFMLVRSSFCPKCCVFKKTTSNKLNACTVFREATMQVTQWSWTQWSMISTYCPVECSTRRLSPSLVQDSPYVLLFCIYWREHKGPNNKLSIYDCYQAGKNKPHPLFWVIGTEDIIIHRIKLHSVNSLSQVRLAEDYTIVFLFAWKRGVFSSL